MAIDIKSLTAEELQAQFKEWGQPAYRVTQLLEWLYVHRVTDWDAMTNLPKRTARQLRAQYFAANARTGPQAGLARHHAEISLAAGDHALIESVLIPANPALYGEASDRHTLCVSTQVGCAYGCKFCASGLDGWKRNLRRRKLWNRFWPTERWTCQGKPHREPSATAIGNTSQRLINNLVIMGMGEPLANYENLLKALQNPERAVGRRHRRAQNHHFHQRPRAANPQAGGRAAAIPPGHFTARRDG